MGPAQSSEQTPPGVDERLNQGPPAVPPPGYPFARDSAIRRYASPGTFLLYGHAAALTLAMAGVAAGVEEHSDYLRAPLGRLRTTIESAIMLLFGDEEESLAIARHLHRFHQTVAGRHDGVDYAANSLVLQRWVLACVYKGAMQEAVARWRPPLPDEERARLYGDLLTFATMFGVSGMPTTPDDMDRYWEEMLEGPELLRTEASRRHMVNVLQPVNSSLPTPIARLLQAVSMTSLDPRLGERLGIRPTAADRRIAAVVDLLMRGYERLPGRLRGAVLPAYVASIRRHRRREVLAGGGRLP